MKIFMLLMLFFLASCHTAREAYQFAPISTYQKITVSRPSDPAITKSDSAEVSVYKKPVVARYIEKKVPHKKLSTALSIVTKRYTTLPKSVLQIVQRKHSKAIVSVSPQDYDVGEMLLAIIGYALCLLSIIPLGYFVAGLVAMDSAAATTAGIVFLTMFGIGLLLYLLNK